MQEKSRIDNVSKYYKDLLHIAKSLKIKDPQDFLHDTILEVNRTMEKQDKSLWDNKHQLTTYFYNRMRFKLMSKPLRAPDVVYVEKYFDQDLMKHDFKDKVLHNDLMTCVEMLDDLEGKAFYLYAIKDMSYEDAAKEMGVKRSTFYIKLKSARKKLAKVFGFQD